MENSKMTHLQGQRNANVFKSMTFCLKCRLLLLRTWFKVEFVVFSLNNCFNFGF